MPVRGIKSRVFLQFWMFFLIALLLNQFLVFLTVLEIGISRMIDQNRLTLQAICGSLGSNSILSNKMVVSKHAPDEEAAARYYFAGQMASGMSSGEAHQKDDLQTAVHLTLNDYKTRTIRTGKTFGMLFPRAKSAILTTTIERDGRIVGAGGVEIPLTFLYRDLRKLQKVSFIFILITSFFFALFGNRQLSRIYFRPLQRLAKKAESYDDQDELFFSVRKEDNDFSILSSALNKMLQRIVENKAALEKTIGSLQTANKELKKAQNDIIRAEKLATVGRLTSGIAHEIGNPIGIVLGYLDLLKQSDLTEEERNDFINRSENEITRINIIIRQLLDMSRSTAGEEKTLSVHQLMDELIGVFKYQPAAKDICFESLFNADNDFVHGDPEQIRQVFLNIMINAIDAVNADSANPGMIQLISSNEADDQEHSSLQGPQFLRVTVKDNGPGIDPAHLDHLFDPFFTTKEPGKGTGLGLSVSAMIVDRLGGKLAAVSKDGGGSCFCVTLPLSTDTIKK
ncbi:sensor histidine kinase [Desulfosarcina ovata]|nr:ATP-binding protein [Desulfosarcina ovata]